MKKSTDRQKVLCHSAASL